MWTQPPQCKHRADSVSRYAVSYLGWMRTTNAIHKPRPLFKKLECYTVRYSVILL